VVFDPTPQVRRLFDLTALSSYLVIMPEGQDTKTESSVGALFQLPLRRTGPEGVPSEGVLPNRHRPATSSLRSAQRCDPA